MTRKRWRATAAAQPGRFWLPLTFPATTFQETALPGRYEYINFTSNGRSLSRSYGRAPLAASTSIRVAGGAASTGRRSLSATKNFQWTGSRVWRLTGTEGGATKLRSTSTRWGCCWSCAEGALYSPYLGIAPLSKTVSVMSVCKVTQKLILFAQSRGCLLSSET